MGIGELIAQFSLNEVPSPLQRFREGRDWKVNHETGIATLMQQRSMTQRAKIDAERVQAEYEDYKGLRELDQRNAKEKALTTSIDANIALDNMDDALGLQRQIDDSIPADAKPTMILKGGLQYPGWKSATTGEEGYLGSGTGQAVRDTARKSKELALKYARDIQLAGMRGEGGGGSLTTNVTPGAARSDIDALLGTTIVSKDKSGLGGVLVLTDIISDEDKKTLKTRVSSAIEEASANYKDQGIAVNRGKMYQEVLDSLVASGAFPEPTGAWDGSLDWVWPTGIKRKMDQTILESVLSQLGILSRNIKKVNGLKQLAADRGEVLTHPKGSKKADQPMTDLEIAIELENRKSQGQ